MKRQAIETSIPELKRLIKDREKEFKEIEKEIGLKVKRNKKFIVPIVNKTKASDKWKFEF